MRQRFTLWRGDERLGWFDERSPVHHHGRVVGAGVGLPADAESAWMVMFGRLDAT